MLFSSTIQTSQISGSQLGHNWPIKFVYKLENKTALCKISVKPLFTFMKEIKSIRVGVIPKKAQSLLYGRSCLV